MNCDSVREHWHLFHDSEGDPELHHQINEHLAMCPGCSRWYFEQSRLEDALAAKLRQHWPSSAMWDRIRAQRVEGPGRRRFFSWARFALAALILGAAAGLIWLGIRSGLGRAAPDLASLSVELHERLASGREALKLHSDSPQEVEQYVRRRVSFPVRCPPREDAGFEVVGGGVCSLAKDPVAYVVGDVEGRRVSVFIMALESLSHYPEQSEAIRRQGSFTALRNDCRVVIGELDRNLVLVVGQADHDRLSRVLKAYGSYPRS